MAAASSNEDSSTSMSVNDLPQTSADMSNDQPFNPIMNQLSEALAGTILEQPPASVMNHLCDVLAATTLDEPQVPTMRSKLLSRKERKKQRKKPRLQDAASAERLRANRAKRLAKRQARKIKKQQKREKKLMSELPSSTCKQHRKRPLPEKIGSSFPRPSLLSEMVRDHEATQEQEDRQQRDGKLKRLLTKIELAKQALQEREAIHTHQKARKMPARESTIQEHSPGCVVDGITDTVME